MTERLPKSERHESMRGYFMYELHNQMRKDPSIWVVSIDLGYGALDKIKRDFPERFINTGASEQSALGIAVGLALEGKKPFVYTISSFYMRAAETISLYVNQEEIPVRMIGAGRDDDYKHDGRSHHAGVTQSFIASMENINTYYPNDFDAAARMCEMMVKDNNPAFISLRR